MNKSIKLSCIEKNISDYAVMISEIFKADLEIVDVSLERVIGTGPFNNNTPILSDGLVYAESFASGKPIIIQSPRRHQLCADCNSKYRCLATMEVVFPLFYKEKEIGAIGILCASYAQKSRMMEDISSGLNTLRVISSMVERDLSIYEASVISKAYIDTYRRMFLESDGCSVITDMQDRVIDMNNNAQKVFGGISEYIGKQLILHQSLNQGLGQNSNNPEPDKVFVTICEKTIELANRPADKQINESHRMYTFSE